MGTNVFISYAHSDLPVVQKIVAEIRQISDCKVWFDVRLHGGDEYIYTIGKAIIQCDTLAFIVSPNSVRSEWCRRELSMAISKGKRIVPIWIESQISLPPDIELIIQNRHYIYYTADYQKFRKEIAEAFESTAVPKKQPTQLQNLQVATQKPVPQTANLSRIILVCTVILGIILIAVLAYPKRASPTSISSNSQDQSPLSYRSEVAPEVQPSVAEILSPSQSSEAVTVEKQFSVGDTLILGACEQNNATGDGAEPIEWIVIKVSGKQILLISKYVLFAGKYHETWASLTWEDSSLRSWLNHDFYNSVFSENEKRAIMKTTITAESNPTYRTRAGADTEDSVFLLSISEAEEMLLSQGFCSGKPTASTRASDKSFQASPCWYWLRSPGKDRTLAAYVTTKGQINQTGIQYNTSFGGIRPAIWINIDNLQ